MTPDVNVVLIDFKVPGREMVVENEDGSYTILINARLSYEGQYKAYKHGMRHITENDFEKSNVQQIEAVAHSETDTSINTKSIKIPENAEYIPSGKYEERIRRLRKKQKRIKKEQQQYTKKIAFLQNNGLDNFFEQAERNYLYGNEL